MNDKRRDAEFTILTSLEPDRLTKHYQLRNGKLRVLAAGAMSVGTAEVRKVQNLNTFGAILMSLKPSQALCYGRPKNDVTRILTEREWLQRDRPEDATPRTRKGFSWGKAPGVMMLDYDPSQAEALGKEELIEALYDAVPELSNYSLLHWVSSSSHIVDTETGKDLTGLRGQRLYFLVQDAADIPRAGKALETYLWAKGYGRIEISVAGSKLLRTLFDGSVWQPERLDFAAGASCGKGLMQRRGKPEYLESLEEIVDTRIAIPDPLPVIQNLADNNIARAKEEAEAEAKKVRSEYLTRRAKEMVGEGATEEQISRCRALLVNGLDDGLLAGDFPIIVVHPDGSEEETTIGHILDNPLAYHNQLTLDPSEPDYDGRRTVGKLYLMSAHQRLHSFAHGGRSYKLVRAPENIEIARGFESETTDKVLALMRKLPDVFDFDKELVSIEDGQLHHLDEHTLAYWLGSRTKFFRAKVTPDGVDKVMESAPTNIMKKILSLSNNRRLKRLEAVITAPLIRSDGTILNLPGYDEATGLYLDAEEEDLQGIKRKVSKDDVREAVERLMLPFDEFPFVGALDRSVMLAAVLTAFVRPVLETAPAFGFDAPLQGSGKTLLGMCISALAGDPTPTVWSHITGGNRGEEEVRKRILTMLMQGKRAMIWDNVLGVMDSVAIASLLTSPTYADRVLGSSSHVEIPNKTMLVFTGNNLMFKGDMTRRVYRCRIDPNTDRPSSRSFRLNPLQYCYKNRLSMASDAMTIIRGHLQSKEPKASGRTASFETWDKLVRQTVAWIGTYVDEWGDYMDPMEAIIQAQEDDTSQEELHDVLSALHGCFGSETFTSGCIEKIARHDYPLDIEMDKTLAYENLISVLNSLTATGRQLNGRTIGMMLMYRKDRIHRGLVLRDVGYNRNKSRVWNIIEV